MATTMTPDLPTPLTQLRHIGWREWDPIGLLAVGEAWEQEPFADEYDAYLLQVAADFRDGKSLAHAIEYLLHIEREHMAVGLRVGQKERAEATARAIRRLRPPPPEAVP
jgi:hypothetical protein